MRTVVIFILLSFFAAFPVSAANVDKNFKEKVFEVLEEDPGRLIEILNNKAQKDREVQEKAALEESLKNPVSPKIEKDRLLYGDMDAPISIVGYLSFQCGYCAESLPIINQLTEEYDGDINFTVKFMPHSEVGFKEILIFETLLSVDKNSAIQFLKYAFENMQAFRGNTDAEIDSFMDNLDMEKSKKEKVMSMYESKEVEPTIRKHVEEAQEFGLSGTPMYSVNGVIIKGLQDKSTFEEVIEKTTNN